MLYIHIFFKRRIGKIPTAKFSSHWRTLTDFMSNSNACIIKGTIPQTISPICHRPPEKADVFTESAHLVQATVPMYI